MRKKILSFIFRKGKFLALRNNPHPEHGGDFWFVVTGSVEKGESNEDAVKREIKEEINLNTEKVIDLNQSSTYEWNGEQCKEENFLSFVKQGEISLNEENVEYRWLDLEDFVNLIRWDEDKNLLKEILRRALNET